MATRRIIDAPIVLAPQGGCAQAVEIDGATRLLFISGQIPVTLNGVVPSGFPAQARLVWANFFAQIVAGGMGLDDLVKINIYLAERIYAAENRAIRREVLGDRCVAMTVVIADIFDPAWLLEIEGIAAR